VAVRALETFLVENDVVGRELLGQVDDLTANTAALQ
jgi:hypothetical protein